MHDIDHSITLLLYTVGKIIFTCTKIFKLYSFIWWSLLLKYWCGGFFRPTLNKDTGQKENFFCILSILRSNKINRQVEQLTFANCGGVRQTFKSLVFNERNGATLNQCMKDGLQDCWTWIITLFCLILILKKVFIAWGWGCRCERVGGSLKEPPPPVRAKYKDLWFANTTKRPWLDVWWTGALHHHFHGCAAPETESISRNMPLMSKRRHFGSHLELRKDKMSLNVK